MLAALDERCLSVLAAVVEIVDVDAEEIICDTGGRSGLVGAFLDPDARPVVGSGDLLALLRAADVSWLNPTPEDLDDSPLPNGFPNASVRPSALANNTCLGSPPSTPSLGINLRYIACFALSPDKRVTIICRTLGR